LKSLSPREVNEDHYKIRLTRFNRKGLDANSMNHSVMIIILILEKHRSWHMCTDCRKINYITIKYKQPISKLNDLHRSHIFQNSLEKHIQSN